MSKCNSCGAEIKWIRLRPKMRSHPVNETPKKTIILSKVEDGEWVGKIIDGYTSHFATCPDAKRWRKEEADG